MTQPCPLCGSSRWSKIDDGLHCGYCGAILRNDAQTPDPDLPAIDEHELARERRVAAVEELGEHDDLLAQRNIGRHRSQGG